MLSRARNAGRELRRQALWRTGFKFFEQRIGMHQEASDLGRSWGQPARATLVTTRELCIFCSNQTVCLAMEVLDKQAFSVNLLIKQVFSELFLNMVRSLLL